MTTQTQELTVQDIEAGYENADWLGYGYLNERRHTDADAQARGDAYVLQIAAAHKWSTVDLFNFVNSRVGRHFGDLVFGGWNDAEVETQLEGMVRWAIREGAVRR